MIPPFSCLLRPVLGAFALMCVAACSDSAPVDGASAPGDAREAQAEFQRVRGLEKGCCPAAEESAP